MAASSRPPWHGPGGVCPGAGRCVGTPVDGLGKATGVLPRGAGALLDRFSPGAALAQAPRPASPVLGADQCEQGLPGGAPFSTPGAFAAFSARGNLSSAPLPCSSSPRGRGVRGQPRGGLSVPGAVSRPGGGGPALLLGSREHQARGCSSPAGVTHAWSFADRSGQRGEATWLGRGWGFGRSRLLRLLVCVSVSVPLHCSRLRSDPTPRSCRQGGGGLCPAVPMLGARGPPRRGPAGGFAASWCFSPLSLPSSLCLSKPVGCTVSAGPLSWPESFPWGGEYGLAPRHGGGLRWVGDLRAWWGRGHSCLGAGRGLGSGVTEAGSLLGSKVPSSSSRLVQPAANAPPTPCVRLPGRGLGPGHARWAPRQPVGMHTRRPAREPCPRHVGEGLGSWGRGEVNPTCDLAPRFRLGTGSCLCVSAGGQHWAPQGQEPAFPPPAFLLPGAVMGCKHLAGWHAVLGQGLFSVTLWAAWLALTAWASSCRPLPRSSRLQGIQGLNLRLVGWGGNVGCVGWCGCTAPPTVPFACPRQVAPTQHFPEPLARSRCQALMLGGFRGRELPCPHPLRCCGVGVEPIPPADVAHWVPSRLPGVCRAGLGVLGQGLAASTGNAEARASGYRQPLFVWVPGQPGLLCVWRGPKAFWPWP